LPTGDLDPHLTHPSSTGLTTAKVDVRAGGVVDGRGRVVHATGDATEAGRRPAGTHLCPA